MGKSAFLIRMLSASIVIALSSCSSSDDKNNVPIDSVPPTPTATTTQIPATSRQVPATDTQVPATDTQVPATDTQVAATDTQVPATDTQVAATDTKVPATDTQVAAKDTQVPDTDTQVPATTTLVPATDTQVAATPAPVRLVSDYSCTATPLGNNVVLSLGGVRAGSENLLINDVWRASLTGEANFTVTNLDTSATIEIRLRGNGYDSPNGFVDAPCERAPAQTPAQALAQTPAPAGLELVWSDDFDGTAIDPTKWEVFIGNYGTPRRLQIYTDAPENVRVENGALILEATLQDGQWYSGMVYTNDVREFDAARWATGNLGWTFGRFEIRAKVPHATGMWPALWMRPIEDTYSVNDEGGWPLNGEIDILEYLGPDRNLDSPNAPINELIANAHWQQDGKRKQQKGTFDLGGPEAAAAFVSEWHTYAVEWTPHRLEYFVDGQSYHVIENWTSDTGGIGPFDQNFDIIMNLQVGGWPGDPLPSSAGSQMEIDWVRVYQDNG